MANVIDFEMEGQKVIFSNMKNYSKDQSARIARGLKRAGLFLQKESMKIVPVCFGFLKSTAFTRAEGEGSKTIVYVGYTSAYAIYVHEILRNAHGQAFNIKHAVKIAAASKEGGRTIWFNRGPLQQAQFLSDPLWKNMNKIFQIIFGEGKK